MLATKYPFGRPLGSQADAEKLSFGKRKVSHGIVLKSSGGAVHGQ